MVNIIKNGERKNNFSVRINPKKEQINDFKSLTGDSLYTWLNNNDYKDEADLLTFKQIFVATLSDFAQFIFTSLRSSEKGHLAVTYSLLRKPLKDNLLIFEMLLSIPNEFLEKFNSELLYKEIAIDNIPAEKKKSIIDDVCSKIPLSLMSSEFIYTVRYSKSDKYGFEPMWQKATHIVTSHKNYQTEKGNLNFIFSDNNAKHEQWEYLYLILPELMFYTYQLVSSLYYGMIAKDEVFDEELWNRLLVGLIIANKQVISDHELFPREHIQEEITLKCQKCGKDIIVTDKLETEIVNSGKYYCSNKHKNEFYKL